MLPAPAAVKTDWAAAGADAREPQIATAAAATTREKGFFMGDLAGDAEPGWIQLVTRIAMTVPKTKNTSKSITYV